MERLLGVWTEVLSYVDPSLLWSVILFTSGVIFGLLLSKVQLSSTLSLRPGSPKKQQQKKDKHNVESPKKQTIKDAISPVKLLHRIASTFLRSGVSASPVDQAEIKECSELARNELSAILGLTAPAHGVHHNWQHVYSNATSQFWVCNSVTSGIKVRGESSADASACSILNWMLQQDAITGIEGLGGKAEIISRTATVDEIVIVRKIYCKAGSGSIMSSKRDFKLVTSITMLRDGTYIIATRSGPWDFENALTGGTGSTMSAASTGSTGSAHEADLAKGYIRGLVYASGYILRPVVYGDEVGCEISFGCHIDMKGARSGRGNTANVNAILSSVLRTIKCLHNGEADRFHHLDGQSLQYIEQVGTWKKAFTAVAKTDKDESPADKATSPLTLDIDNDPAGEEQVQLHAPVTQSLFNASLPTKADRYRLLSVARDAANRLRAQYADTLGADSGGLKPRTSFSGVTELRRETFYDQDGIMIKELDRRDMTVVSSMGVFSVTFTVQATAETIQKLLVNRPDSIDGFVEGRAILNYLSSDSYVQWLAYGAMFPVSAKDFLLVTTQEPWDKKTKTGFVIASASIDDVCQLDSADKASLVANSGNHSDGAADNAAISNAPAKRYQRTNVRLAGYVGVPNADGSTTVTFILDMPHEHKKSTGWLLRYVAQYALTELVGRIRHAVSPFNLGSERTLQLLKRSAQRAASDADLAEPTSPGGSLMGGGGTRTADLGRMLAGIQEREQHAARRCNHIERVHVQHPHRDRTNSVDLTSAGEDLHGERSRLHSVGYSTWKDVRSRTNSEADQEGEDSETPTTGVAADMRRLPPLSPAAVQRGTSLGSSPYPDGSASTGKDGRKGLTTFQLLKRSLSKKKKVPASPSLRLSNMDEEDSDYRLGTPDASPRTERKTLHFPLPPPPLPHDTPPGTPQARQRSGTKSLVRPPLPGMRHSSRGEEVDLHSVQRELSKISPSRRNSKTAQRRRTLSQSEDGLLSLDLNAAPMQAGHGMPGVPAGVHRSQSSTDAAHAHTHPAKTGSGKMTASQSLNDLPSLLDQAAAVSLQGAWDTYSVYFDAEKSRTKLGIDWQLKLNKPNIHIYSSMVENNSWCAIKAVTVMQCEPMALVKVLLNYDRMGEYDNMFKTSMMVKQVDECTVIRRLCFKEVWPTAPRDFVVCASWRKNDDGSVSIVSRSVADSFCAQEKGYVRGFLQVSGYLLEPYNAEKPVALPLSCAKDGFLAPGELKVTLLNHTELGGTLPASVINVLSTNAPMKILSTLAGIVCDK